MKLSRQHGSPNRPTRLRRLLLGMGVVGLAALGCSQRQPPREDAANPTPQSSAPQPASVAHPQPETLAPFQGDLALQPVAALVKPEQITQETRQVSWWAGIRHVALASRIRPPSSPPLAVAWPLAHADDYRWLSGELYYSAVRRKWCLHYASAEDPDAHGGSVTLVVPPTLTARLHGSYARVRGHLLNPSSRQPSPAYEVEALESVQY